MIRYGVDVGSTTAKIVTLTPELRYRITETRAWETLLEGIPSHEIASTGYFRHKIPHRVAATEITTAIYGVREYISDPEVIVDIGGQDTKVIDVQRNNFIVNDKCSAGTGAFLEFIAHHFGLRVTDLSEIHEKATRTIKINHTCSVFALSEVVSHLVDGCTVEDLIASIHQAFAERIAQMIPDDAGEIVLIGGTAQNRGIIRALEEILGERIYTPPNPQIINALGALRYGEEREEW